MRKLSVTLFLLASLLASLGLVLVFGPTPDASAGPGGVRRFATLPPGAPGHPEGVATDAAGNVYAASFELTELCGLPVCPAPEGPFPRRRKGPQGDPLPPFQHNYIYTFGQNGRLTASTPLPPFVVPLGMVVKGNELFVNDVINGNVLRYVLPLTPFSVPAQVYDLCGGFVVAFGAPGEFCALNANAVGPDGRIYISDNGAGDFGFFNGRIWVLDPVTAASGVFWDTPQLDVAGFPPFGVNGVAVRHDEWALYMANMSTDVIYKLTLTSCNTGACTPGVQSVFVPAGSGIDGPDNIAFDQQDNLWVASGQNDSVVGVDPSGLVFAQVGTFQGFAQDGAPKNLLQPSGIVVTSWGKVCVGNEANQTLRPAADPIDWDQLRAFTISCFNP